MKLSEYIDRANSWIGRSAAWLILIAVLVSAGNAVIRKGLGISSNAWLELQWYLFGAVFMLGASWTLARDEHVRIDVVTAHLSKRTRDWIDLCCHVLFLMPFAILMSWLSWPFFMNSYKSGEMSMNAGGLIIWPAKILILVGFIMFTIQGISEIIKKVAILRGGVTAPAEREEEQLPPEVREFMHVDSEAKAANAKGHKDA